LLAYGYEISPHQSASII